MNARSVKSPSPAATLAYVAPIAPVWALHAPALSLLPALYAKYAGLELAVIGAILISTRLLDGFTDPLMGYLSDRTKTRFGKRKPWILAGMLLIIVSTWFWFRPGPETGAVYFLLSSMGVYIGWTMIEIPHSAWFADLYLDYDERSRVAAYRSAMSYIGYAIFYMAPFLPFFATTEFTPEVISFTSWVIIGLLLVTIPAALWIVPDGEVSPQAGPGFRDMIKCMGNNRPFLIYIASISATFLASGMVGGLYVFFMDAYLGIADKIAHVAISVTIISLLSTRLWPPIMKRVGKHRALAISGTTTVLTLVAMAFIRPGPGALTMMLTVFGLSAISASALTICMLSIMADVIDYDELRSGVNNAAIYYSFNAIINKMGIAIGGGAALMIAGLFGFSMSNENDHVAMTGFYMAFLGIPIILNIISVTLALRFPLDKRRQAIISKRLTERAQRQRSKPI